MNCPNCHQEIADGAQFCHHCGTRIETPGEQQVKTEASQTENPYLKKEQTKTAKEQKTTTVGASTSTNLSGGLNPKTRNIIIVIIVAAVAAIITMALVSNSRPTPEETISKLEKGLNALDQNEVLACFDQQSQDLSNSMTSLAGQLTGMKNFATLLNGFGGLVAGSGQAPKYTLTVNSVQYYDDDHCVADVTMAVDYKGSIYEKYVNDTSQTDKVQFPMEYDDDDDMWKITMDTSFISE